MLYWVRNEKAKKEMNESKSAAGFRHAGNRAGRQLSRYLQFGALCQAT